MRERRHLPEQLRLNVRTGHEHVCGLEPRGETSLDQILPLDREQPELVPPVPVVELADELEPLVVARGDQAADWLSSALFACSAIAPNAAGSLTARSARTLRSSSIPAFEHPCTNWL